jgi:hypothetical protein
MLNHGAWTFNQPVNCRPFHLEKVEPWRVSLRFTPPRFSIQFTQEVGLFSKAIWVRFQLLKYS